MLDLKCRSSGGSDHRDSSTSSDPGTAERQVRRRCTNSCANGWKGDIRWPSQSKCVPPEPRGERAMHLLLGCLALLAASTSTAALADDASDIRKIEVQWGEA